MSGTTVNLQALTISSHAADRFCERAMHSNPAVWHRKALGRLAGALRYAEEVRCPSMHAGRGQRAYRLQGHGGVVVMVKDQTVVTVLTACMYQRQMKGEK